MNLLLWILYFPVLGGQEEALARQRAAMEAQTRSIDTQRAAIRRQAGLAAPEPAQFFVTMDDLAAAKTADCGPLSPIRIRGLVDTESRRAGISPDLLQAVMQQESAFRPCAVSPKGAMGLMQLMPATAEQLGVSDPFDPDGNVSAGAHLLKQLIDRYAGDLNRALGAYNAGPARVDAAGGVPGIPETMNYVETIMGKLKN